VESTILHHAHGLHALGCRVRIISGNGAPFHPGIETLTDPLFGSMHPAVLAAKDQLDRGIVPHDFPALVTTIAQRLETHLSGCDAVFVHNVHTMHKNLALTAALHALQRPLIAWVHDLAWAMPQYAAELHPGYPWDLLRTPWPGTRYITISQARRTEVCALLQLESALVPVVSPGLDIAAFSAWTPLMRELSQRLGLLDADRLLLVPARLTRRKNIAFALHVLAHLRARTGSDDRLIVTGPPGPHNPANHSYFDTLRALRSTLGLDAGVHFLYELGTPHLIPDDATVASLFRLADALLFPSESEGFGIPLLEAAVSSLPIFCADLPVFHEIIGEAGTRFDPHGDPQTVAASIDETLSANPAARLKRHIRRHARWDVIVREQVFPLIP
jgi:glycosyltransferase involved in cell wall biosynthesis